MLNSIFSALICIPIFFYRPPLFQRKRCGVGIVVLGAAAIWFCDPVGLGDQPGGVAAGNYFLADTRAERTRWPAALVRVRATVGNRSTDQYFYVVILAGFRIVGMVSARETR